MIDRMLCASLMIRICTSGQTHSLRCDIVITASDGCATMRWYIYIYVCIEIDTSVYMSKRVSVCENRPISHQNKHHLNSDSTEQTAHMFTSNTCVWHDRVTMCAIRNLDFKDARVWQKRHSLLVVADTTIETFQDDSKSSLTSCRE